MLANLTTTKHQRPNDDAGSAGSISMHAAMWIGDATLPEFAPAADVLRSRIRLVVFATIDDALRSASGEFDVVILAEAMPGGTAQASTERLRRRHCGVPLVRLVGPLCDGELRSSPPETAPRLRWLEAPQIFASDCEALTAGRCPTWGRPVTQSVEETLLETVDAPVDPAVAKLRVAVDACDAAVAAWLKDLAKALGATVVAAREGESVPWIPDVVLHQIPPRTEAGTSPLADVRGRYPNSRIVAMGGFLRRETAERYRAAGADAIASLPAVPGELERLLSRK